jgi:hypothetical protein
LDAVVEGNTELAQNISGINTESKKDEVLLADLASRCLRTANVAEGFSENLATAIYEDDPDLPSVLYETAREIPNLMDTSMSDDEIFMDALDNIEDPNIKKVVKIYALENQERMEQAWEKKYQKKLERLKSNPLVSKYLKPESPLKSFLPSVEPGEIDLEDIEFEDVLPPDSPPTSPGRNVSDILANESLILVDLTNESLDLIEDEIQPIIIEAIEGAQDEAERSLLEEAAGGVEKIQENLNECLHVAGTLNATLEMERSQNL